MVRDTCMKLKFVKLLLEDILLYSYVIIFVVSLVADLFSCLRGLKRTNFYYCRFANLGGCDLLLNNHME